MSKYISALLLMVLTFTNSNIFSAALIVADEGLKTTQMEADVEVDAAQQLLINRIMDEHITYVTTKVKKRSPITFKCTELELKKFGKNKLYNEVMNKLTTNNVGVNTQDRDGKTLITKFASFPDINLNFIKFLIKLGANPNITDKGNRSILHDLLMKESMHRSDCQMQKLLITLFSGGATLTGVDSMSIYTKLIDLFGWEQTNYDLLKQLLTINTQDYLFDGHELQSMTTKPYVESINSNLQDKAGMTPLMWLLIKKFTKVIAALLPLVAEKGLVQNCSLTNIEGDTAITLAGKIGDPELEIQNKLLTYCLPVLDTVSAATELPNELSDISSKYLFGIDVKASLK